jgi:hypothetical protein
MILKLLGAVGLKATQPECVRQTGHLARCISAIWNEQRTLPALEVSMMARRGPARRGAAEHAAHQSELLRSSARSQFCKHVQDPSVMDGPPGYEANPKLSSCLRGRPPFHSCQRCLADCERCLPGNCSMDGAADGLQAERSEASSFLLLPLQRVQRESEPKGACVGNYYADKASPQVWAPKNLFTVI